MESLLTYGIFLRLLALVFFVQFASTLAQIIPILGRRGIEPAHVLLRSVRRDLPGPLRFLRFPTLFWIGDTDWALRGVCLLGMLASLGNVVGCAGAAGPVLFGIAWACWISILTVGSTCFALPWDNLLCEAGLIALFMPGVRALPELGVLHAPIPIAVLAFRWLLFRVMFGMGLAKFWPLDAQTRDGTFLQRYYDRQPMPTVLAFHARVLPMWVHKISLFFFFVVEIIVPFLFFGPWAIRGPAAAATIALQGVIWLTGNYGIFNVLTAVLAVPLLAHDFSYAGLAGDAGVRSILAVVVLGGQTLLSLPYAFLLDSWTGAGWLFSKKTLASHRVFRQLGPLTTLFRWAAPFHVANAYGIFVPGVFRRRRMVTVIQGSDDGVTWLDYEPRFLPCAVDSRPRRFAPYHPRFDHYLYYERGLAPYRTFVWLSPLNPYYLHPHCFKEKVVQKLLRSDPAALSLFRRNPFPAAPPKWIRYSSWAYEFNSPAEKTRTGNYWRRELVGVSVPIEADESLDEFAGVHPDFRPFIADSVCYLEGGAVAFVDAKTGKKVPIQQHPIELMGSMPS